MASLETRLKAALSAVATDIKTLTTNQGALASLTTTNKSSLVASLNELKGLIDQVAAAAGAQISDGVTSATNTWSSNKITSAITAAVDALVNGAGTAVDTLGELAAQLAADQTALSGIVTSLGKRLRFDQAQTLTSGEQAQALANLGLDAKLGDTDSDLVAHYTAAKA